MCSILYTIIYSLKEKLIWYSMKLSRYTEKKDLIESKKIICLNDFLWFKEMICLNAMKFVWFKQNIFEPNKYLFESNQFFFKTKKLMHWYMVKDIICLI